MKKKIVLAGGSGFIGGGIIKFLGQKYFEFVVLTRKPKKRNDGVKEIEWDAKTIGPWAAELENAEALINLTGKSINCRYTEKNKLEIIESRVNSTTVLGKAILEVKHPPKVWVNASSAAIYRQSGSIPSDENTKATDIGFLAKVVKAWENAFYKSELLSTKKFALRITIVLGKQGGVIPRLENLVRFGLGGKQGTGEQFFSWIHEDDFYRAINWCIENPEKGDVYNCSTPLPVTNSFLMQTLRKNMHMPVGLPAAEWMIKAGALFIGTEPGLILNSMNVVPTNLIKQGFTFTYPDINSALKNLLSAPKGLK